MDSKATTREIEGRRPKMAETWPEMISRLDHPLRAWPKRTLCIVSNEFCERFSFYGMRTVLTLYLMNVLKYSRNMSTVYFNGFTVLCYFMPMLGSILADGYIGKFKTIFFVSIIYALGQITLAVASTQSSASPLHPWLDFTGLMIIAIGTGGIKPCVASFGADQFASYQEKMLSLFFSVFYFSINAGAMISTFVTPIFRAFGVPAALMVFATCIFLAGSYWYDKPPPKENIYGEVFQASKTAICNRLVSSSKRRSHWLDYYFDTHNCGNDAKCMELQRKKREKSACHKKEFINDIKSLCRLLIMYLPVPMFWALYDQQGSTWMIQSIQMDCRLWGDTLLLPDQMQTLNAVLILAFIPLFQIVIYPMVSCFFTLTPLRKMVAGGVIGALAFAVSALVQFQVNTTLPDLPPAGNGFVTIMNTFDTNCTVTASIEGKNKIQPVMLAPNEVLINDRLRGIKQLLELPSGSVSWSLAYSGAGCANPSEMNLPEKVTYEVTSGGTFYLAVGPLGTFFSQASTEKPTQATGEFSLGIALAMTSVDYAGNLALCRKGTGDVKYPCDPRSPDNFHYYERMDGDPDQNDFVETQAYRQSSGSSKKTASIYKFKPIKPGSWKLYFMLNTPKKIGQQSYSKEEVKVEPTDVEFEMREQGGVYLMVVTGTKQATKKHVFQAVSNNVVSILWQVPQIAIITAAEILFSITGYEFAYSQAAPSMKSLVQGAWLLTTAIGDTIIVIIALVDISDMAVLLLFYTGLMLAVIFVFALMSIFYYEYNYYVGDEGATGYSEFDNQALEGEAGPEDWAIDAPKDALRRRTLSSIWQNDSALARQHVGEYGTDKLAEANNIPMHQRGDSWKQRF